MNRAVLHLKLLKKSKSEIDDLAIALIEAISTPAIETKRIQWDHSKSSIGSEPLTRWKKSSMDNYQQPKKTMGPMQGDLPC